MNASRLKQRRWVRFIPAVLCMAVIFILSSRTGEELDTVLPWMQKLFPGMTDFNWGHYAAYFILAIALDFGFGAKADRVGTKLLIVLLCGLYGVTDEYHQSFVGGRMMDIMDLRNDMIGALTWTVIISIPPLRRIWRKIAA